MELALQFRADEKDRVLRAFEALKPGATVLFPPGPVFYSECKTEFVDRFGVRWCLFI